MKGQATQQVGSKSCFGASSLSDRTGSERIRIYIYQIGRPLKLPRRRQSLRGQQRHLQYRPHLSNGFLSSFMQKWRAAATISNRFSCVANERFATSGLFISALCCSLTCPSQQERCSFLVPSELPSESNSPSTTAWTTSDGIRSMAKRARRSEETAVIKRLPRPKPRSLCPSLRRPFRA